MALLDVLIPQMADQVLNSDWNHWKYQFESYIKDINDLSSKSGPKREDNSKLGTSEQTCGEKSNTGSRYNRWQESEYCKPGTSRQQCGQQSNTTGFDCGQWQNILSEVLGMAQNHSNANTSRNSSDAEKKSDKFEIKLDVSNFSPQDITVKTNGNNVIVIGKHGEKRDEFGFVSREFTRRYELPSDVDLDSVTSYMSKGVLIIEANKKNSEQPNESNEFVIPVVIEKDIDVD